MSGAAAKPNLNALAVAEGRDLSRRCSRLSVGRLLRYGEPRHHAGRAPGGEPASQLNPPQQIHVVDGTPTRHSEAALSNPVSARSSRSKFHPAVRFANLDEAELAVEVLRVPSDEQTKSKTLNHGMLDCFLNKEAADLLTSDSAVNKDITEPSERDAVGNPSREPDLGPGVVKTAQCQRLLDRFRYKVYRSARRPIALFAEPPMNSWHVETISIIRDENAIRTCPLHGTMLGVVRLQSSTRPGPGA